ncbi:MAG TPA: cupin domain-containing protein [Rhizomicrobium sp.]|nr:cupin domain-containing protein [Rhizomicrobium sp.]
MSEADALIARLRLAPHPEGGHYRETFRDAHSTAILFLLRAGEASRRHRVDRSEIWHFYRGDALELIVGDAAHVLSADNPQIVVPAHVWQSARPLGAYTLVGCTVAPPFSFDGFELG